MWHAFLFYGLWHFYHNHFASYFNLNYPYSTQLEAWKKLSVEVRKGIWREDGRKGGNLLYQGNAWHLVEFSSFQKDFLSRVYLGRLWVITQWYKDITIKDRHLLKTPWKVSLWVTQQASPYLSTASPMLFKCCIWHETPGRKIMLIGCLS